MTSIEERVRAAHNHPSHPSFILGDWQPFEKEHLFLNQYISSCLMTLIFAFVLYYSLTALNYLVFFVIGKQRFTPNREKLRSQKQKFWHDIKWSALNIIGEAPLVTLIKMGYPYYSKVQYEFIFTPKLVIYILLHYLYDQFFTYWIHRLLHHPKIYKKLHFIHHQSKAVTPFTGFAFHPIDAFLQAVPAFTSCYFLPLPIDFVLLHGLMTSVWAISIHDNVNYLPFKGILYAGSHSIHHFPWGQNYNYGKFTSICDRLYGTYCDPEGITGYGYKLSKSKQKIFVKLNKIYTNLIPDKGLQTVSKIRELFSKKIQ